MRRSAAGRAAAPRSATVTGATPALGLRATTRTPPARASGRGGGGAQGAEATVSRGRGTPPRGGESTPVAPPAPRALRRWAPGRAPPAASSRLGASDNSRRNCAARGGGGGQPLTG